MVNCKNCTKLFEGSFCPSCGQRLIHERYTTKESVSWLFSSIFNLEKGFIYTTKSLTINPGEVVRDFWNGVTVRYSHPFRFLFIWASVSAIIMHYTNALESTSAMFADPATQKEGQIAFQKMYLGYMKKYMSFFIMSMVPLSSLASYLILKRKKFNYAEHLILNAYSSAISIVIGLPFVALYFVLDDTQNIMTLTTVLSFLVIGRVYAKTFKENVLLGIVKYFFVFALTMLFFMILLMIALIAYIVIAKSMGMKTIFETTAAMI